MDREIHVNRDKLDASTIRDLRSALSFLDRIDDGVLRIPNRLLLQSELASLYAHVGGGCPIVGPVKTDAPLLFEDTGIEDASVLVGLFASRRRCADLISADPERIANRILQAVGSPVPVVDRASPPCQEEVHRDHVDLGCLPIPTITADDAGPYITLGLVMAGNRATGEQNISIHRLCVQGRDRLTIWIVPGRDLEALYLEARARGENLPVSINIGLDPAIYIASGCTSPLVPRGVSELTVAGALRERPVEISPCVSADTHCIAQSEIVIEGEITAESIPENGCGDGSMPEFLGYNGQAHPNLPVIRVTAITHRKAPIFQTVIGPGREQSNLLAFGMEAAAVDLVSRYTGQKNIKVHASTAGGGQLLLFIQYPKTGPQDDGIVRRIGAALMGAFRMVKLVVLVDSDVDIFSEQDIWWAMTTRFQANKDIIRIDDVQGFSLDPSQNPDFSPLLSEVGFTSKAAFDCTVPYRLQQRFSRTDFPPPANLQNMYWNSLR